MPIVPPRFARRAVGVSLIALAAAGFCAPAAQAKEARRPRDDAGAATAQIPWSPRHEYESIIVELPPLHPWKKNAADVMPKPAANPAPAVAEKAPPSAEKPALVDAAAAQPPQMAAPQTAAAPSAPAPAEAAPAQAAPASAAEAKPGEPQTAQAAAAEQPPAPASAAEAKPAEPAAAQVSPPSPAVTEAPKADAPPVESAVAAAPAAEPAAPPAEAPKPLAEAGAEAQAPAAQAPAAEAAAPADPVAALLAEGVQGPAEVRFADRATMWLPAGRVFLGAEPARKLLDAFGLPTYPETQGVVLPAGEGRPGWTARVELIDGGYVKDSAAGELDPAKLLEAFKANLGAANAGRVEKGRAAFEALGWSLAPRVDDKHRLSACVGATIAGSQDPVDRIYQCQAFALGRQGALALRLSTGEANIGKLKGEAAALAETIVYDKGKSYADIDAAADAPAPFALSDLAAGETAAKRLADSPFTGGVKEPDYAQTLVDVVYDNGELIAIALVALLLVARRFAGGAGEAEASAAAPTKADDAGKEASAGLLASLKSKFARTEVEKAAKSAESEGASEAASGGFFARLRGRVARGGNSDEAAAAAPQPVEAPVLDEEPASALGKLAQRMRKAAPEAPAAGPDLSRVARSRSLPGAAPQVEASESASESASGAPAAASPDEFSLVEPGDQQATSAAISARRALREARA